MYYSSRVMFVTTTPRTWVFIFMVHALDLIFFFFNDTATTEIYTLSLHDALPISKIKRARGGLGNLPVQGKSWRGSDRKSTRLNSSHSQISYAVFCLKKKN